MKMFTDAPPHHVASVSKGEYIGVFPKVVKQDSYWITDTSKHDKNIDVHIFLV